MKKPAFRMPILDEIEHRAQTNPGQPAITDATGTLTYAQLWDEASSCERAMMRLATEGAVVGLVLPNTATFVGVLLGVARAGCPAVLFPANVTETELHAYAGAIGTQFLVTDQARTHVIEAAGGRLAAQWTDKLNVFSLKGIDESAAMRASGPENHGAGDVALQTGDFIAQFTSGQDQPSKAAIRTHETVWTEIRSVGNTIGITANDTSLVVTKISHSYGLIGGTLAPLTLGGHVVLPACAEPDYLARVILESRSTLLFAIPTMYRALLSVATRDHFSSLRFCLSAGSPLPRLVDDSFAERFGKRLSQDYGTTECGTISLRLDWSSETAGSVGRPLPHTSVEVVDAEGNKLPPGHSGEVVVRSSALARGYLTSPAVGVGMGYAGVLDATYYSGQGRATATSRATTLANNRFVTGDLGWLDSNGNLFLAGRKTGIICIGNAQINPVELEELIAEIPGVRDVAVIGTAGPETLVEKPVPEHPLQAPCAQRLKAIVVADGVTAEDIRRHCDACPAKEHVPQIIEFRASIPRTTSGKLLRRALT